MDLSYSPEQDELRHTLRRYLAERTRDGDLWPDLARTMGIAAIGIDERLGGGSIEHAIVAEELGRALAVTPLIDTVVMAAPLLAQAHATLRAIAAGESIVAIAVFEPTMRYAIEGVAMRAKHAGDGWVLDGAKSVVAHGDVADRLLVAARTGGSPGDRDGLSLFLIDATAPGIARHSYPALNRGNAADIVFTGVRTDADALIGTAGKAADAIEAMLDRGIAALAADGVGVMRRAIADTLDYVKVRRQFGQPLAELQAVQHRLADMYVELELASGAALLATLKLSAPADQRTRAVSAAGATVSKAMRFVGQNAIQLHGGMGMTDELAISTAFRRMTAIDGALGTFDRHITRYQTAGQAA